MTQQERSQVWARKVELTQALSRLPDTAASKKQREQIRAKIEQCNTELIQDQITPDSAKPDESKEA